MEWPTPPIRDYGNGETDALFLHRLQRYVNRMQRCANLADSLLADAQKEKAALVSHVEHLEREPLAFTETRQATGVLDRDGNMIRVGDIVDSWADTATQYLRVVYRCADRPEIRFDPGTGAILCDATSVRLRIVGNIYDNPELIPGTAEHRDEYPPKPVADDLPTPEQQEGESNIIENPGFTTVNLGEPWAAQVDIAVKDARIAELEAELAKAPREVTAPEVTDAMEWFDSSAGEWVPVHGRLFPHEPAFTKWIVRPKQAQPSKVERILALLNENGGWSVHQDRRKFAERVVTELGGE